MPSRIHHPYLALCTPAYEFEMFCFLFSHLTQRQMLSLDKPISYFHYLDLCFLQPYFSCRCCTQSRPLILTIAALLFLLVLGTPCLYIHNSFPQFSSSQSSHFPTLPIMVYTKMFTLRRIMHIT